MRCALHPFPARAADLGRGKCGDARPRAPRRRRPRHHRGAPGPRRPAGHRRPTPASVCPAHLAPGPRCGADQRPRAPDGVVRRARPVRRSRMPRRTVRGRRSKSRSRPRHRRPPSLRRRRCDAMTTALIAEDEPMMRAQLRGRLTQAWPELEIVAEAGNGEEAIALAERKAARHRLSRYQNAGAVGPRCRPRARRDAATSCSSRRTTTTRSPPSTKAPSTTF